MEPPHNTTDRTTLFVAAWAGTLAMLLAATWRLWTSWRGTPRIAPLEVLGAIPPAIDFALLALVVYGLVQTIRTALASGLKASPRCQSGVEAQHPLPTHDLHRGLAVYRVGIVIATLALVGLMLLDQLRWQPWAYHAVLAGVILANATPPQAFRLLRLVAIAVYAYSAIAKLNAEFAATLGQQMLDAIGLGLASWSDTTRTALALTLPIVELAIAGLLAASLKWQRLRVFACVAVIAMHGTTIAVLGPWALGHSLGVLLWNVGFAAQTAILFWPQTEETTEPVTRSSRLALAACSLAVLAPALTPFGLWDQWPGWALYAPRGERATLFVHTASVERLPRSLLHHVEQSSDGPWRRVRLDKWALAETAAPIYPQNRIVAAMGLGLMERYALTGRVQVVDESAASPFSRTRQLTEHAEKDSIADAARLLGLKPAITWTDNKQISRR
jgi:hypothetical protein